MVLATVLQYSQLKKRSLKKVKASDGIQTRAFQIFIKCDHTTISTTSADHINLKILLKIFCFQGQFYLYLQITVFQFTRNLISIVQNFI